MNKATSGTQHFLKNPKRAAEIIMDHMAHDGPPDVKKKRVYLDVKESMEKVLALNPFYPS